MTTRLERMHAAQSTMVRQALMMIRSVESIASSRKNFSLFHSKCLPEAIAHIRRKHDPDTLKVLESLPRFDYGVRPPEGVRNEVQVLPGQQLADGGWYFGEWALGERKEMEGRGILVTKEGGV